MIDNYGENVIHKRTKIFDACINLDDYPKLMNLKEMAKKNKNIRKPHEIIILTDGFSFSAASYFIKGIQLNGRSIVVGYSGNPNSFFFLIQAKVHLWFIQLEILMINYIKNLKNLVLQLLIL